MMAIRIFISNLQIFMLSVFIEESPTCQAAGAEQRLTVLHPIKTAESSYTASARRLQVTELAAVLKLPRHTMTGALCKVPPKSENQQNL